MISDELANESFNFFLSRFRKIIIADCREYDISKVVTEPGGTPWRPGEGARYSRHDGDFKVISLNPNINREEVASQIRRRHGIIIKPDEVYLWLWFHEIGHIVYEDDLKEAWNLQYKATWGFLQTGVHISPAERKRYRELVQDAEKRADKYANSRFKISTAKHQSGESPN